jgi:hypothetical protein
MRVFVNLSVFGSPTEPLGSATGLIPVDATPQAGRLCPWSQAKLAGAEPQIVEQLRQVKVIEVDTEPFIKGADLAIQLEEVVCDSAEAAQSFADFLEKQLGLVFCKY